MTGGPPPGRPGAAQIGARKLVGEVIGTIKYAVGQAMDEIRLEVAGGITELVTEISEGGKNVRRALQDEAMGVRVELAGIVGNAEALSEEAVAEARKIAVEANGDG